jgi:hypothetical protein
MSTMAEHTSYRGPERRRHRVFVTRNTEYHCRDGVCVAVRDRRTRRFAETHPAIGKHISGGLRFNQNGGIESASMGADLKLGEQVCFSGDTDKDRSVFTSPLAAIERPEKDVVAGYLH